ncbi:MAG: endosialidase [Eubacteriales bacterium]|nr:endosialidase [Eubacteriales bacterium]
MAAVKELLRAEENGTLSFGDYELAAKKKLADFEFNGDLYKVKTYKDITKLECNEILIYESVPGTAVQGLQVSDKGMTFHVEGPEDAQITLGVEEDTEYEVLVNGTEVGRMRTNMGGKLSFSVEFTEGEAVAVTAERV